MILSCGDQGAFQPQSWWKVTKELFNLETGAMVIKGLFNLNLDKREPRGFSALIWAIGMSIKGLFNFDLSCWNVNQRVFQLWSECCLQKVKKLGLYFKWWGLCCSIVIFLCSFLILKKKKKNSISKKTLMDFCGSLKNIFSLWNSKLGIWDFETWNLRLWNFASWNFEIWDFENLQLEIFETRDLRIFNLKFWTLNLECGILNSRLKIWDLEFESEYFILNPL